jgi:pimeloyl-ACP methyl ester carboxylesterase
LTHGYIASGKSNVPIAQTYSQKYPNHNVIVVDWGKLSKKGIPVLSNGFININKEYIAAADNAIQVGQAIGDLVQNLGLDPGQVTLVGHSLGARASQYASERIAQKAPNRAKIKYLILLDPAGPGFQNRPWDKFVGGGRIRCLPQGQLAGKTIAVHTSKRWGDETQQGDIDVHATAQPVLPTWQIDNHTYANKYWHTLVQNGQDKKLINSSARNPFKPTNPVTKSVFYR